MQTLALALLFASVAVTAHETPSNPSPKGQAQFPDALNLIDAWLDAQVVFDRVPALSAGVISGDRLVWQRAYGTIDRAGKTAAQTDTIYGICSISKLFTSIAVMQLWEDGKLSLDKDVATVLLPFGIQRDIPDSGPITVLSLLTHSSGLPREAARSYWTPPDFDFPSRDELLSQLRNQHVSMRPSERWQYSNLGMAILGEVVSEVSGTKYNEYVREHILRPLKLSDTRPGLPNELYGTRLALGFGALKRDGTRDIQKLYDAKGLTPAVGFSSTVEDLARFVAWQFRLRSLGGREVLRAATLRDMQRVQWTDPDGKRKWGLGFAMGDGQDGTGTVVGHEGSCPGYETLIRMALEKQVGLIVLTNATDAPVPGLVKSIMGVLFKAIGLPRHAAANPNLASYAGRYARQPWASEQVVVPWGVGLAALDLPNDDPGKNMMILRHTAGDTFRVVRDDGSLADEVTFQRDAARHVIGYRRWNQSRPRMRP